MPSLKSLRIRINSVKSTQKITSAMKMVAASKLRRAQQQAEAARPYAERMARMLAALAANVAGSPTAPRLLVGTGRDQVHLLVAVTADRGLAGGFNTNVGRATRALARRLLAEGKTVKILAVGRKGRDYLRREFADKIVRRRHLCRPQAHRVYRRARRRRAHRGDAERRRVRRLHHRLQPLRVGGHPGHHRDAPDPGTGAGGGRRRPRAVRARSTSSSPTRKPCWPNCCRPTSTSRSIAPCWKARPASTARGWRRWTTPPATPAT